MSDSSPGFSTQRTLAAIIFTDAVSFSARVQQDEVGTLKLLHRDFGVMRRLCTENQGAVLKTTGDGLLMTFASAVHAVACALALQRYFASESKDQAASKNLQHRIGIHLGDILVQNQDVMGDGVNIAARLQAEAEPGGICISQTVYDVVKNKIELQVVSLGARELKNITQAVPVYRILLEAQALHPESTPAIPVGGGASTTRPPVAPAPVGARSRLPLILVGAAALAAVFVAGVVVSRRQKEAVPAPTAPATAPAPVAPAPAAATVAAPVVPVRSPEEEALELEFAKRKEMLQARTQYLDQYDFDGFARSLRAASDSTPPAARASQQAMLRSVESMGALKDWMNVSLRRYTKLRPMPVRDLSGDATRDTAVFIGADKRFVFVENGNVRTLEWTEIKPPALASIIASSIREIKQGQTRDVILGAQAFSRIYNLPALLDALPAAPGAPRQGVGQLPGQGQGQGQGQGRNGAQNRAGRPGVNNVP